MAEWILLIYIVSGDHHGFKMVEFQTRERCIEARDWANKVDLAYRKPWKPKAECFRRR